MTIDKGKELQAALEHDFSIRQEGGVIYHGFDNELAAFEYRVSNIIEVNDNLSEALEGALTKVDYFSKSINGAVFDDFRVSIEAPSHFSPHLIEKINKEMTSQSVASIADQAREELGREADRALCKLEEQLEHLAVAIAIVRDRIARGVAVPEREADLPYDADDDE